jgi:hypothetical protein
MTEVKGGKEKPNRVYRGHKVKRINELMEENPNLTLAEASKIFMAELRVLQARKRELLKDFAPEKAKEPYLKMRETAEENIKKEMQRKWADMDYLEQQEARRRARKGLPPLNDQVVIPLLQNGSISPSKVLNNIEECKKPTHIKDAFIETFNTLQLPENEPFSLTAWAKMNPSQFYLLVTKLIPQQTPDEKNAPLQIKSITFE